LIAACADARSACNSLSMKYRARCEQGRQQDLQQDERRHHAQLETAIDRDNAALIRLVVMVPQWQERQGAPRGHA
jgi:hypothetical protein